MQIQSVFKAGNSDVVSIPLDIKKKTGIRTGTDVVVSVATDGKTIMITKAGEINTSVITPEFFNWLGDFNKKYRSALEELSEK